MNVALDAKAIQKDVEAEMRKEAIDIARGRLKSQMRIVESANAVVANEQRKLNDIIASISEGN